MAFISSDHCHPGIFLSQALGFGTRSHWMLDNLKTIYYYSKRNWKHSCSSSSERVCGSKSNKGPYKCSILLLLLRTTFPGLPLSLYMHPYILHAFLQPILILISLYIIIPCRPVQGLNWRGGWGLNPLTSAFQTHYFSTPNSPFDNSTTGPVPPLKNTNCLGEVPQFNLTSYLCPL